MGNIMNELSVQALVSAYAVYLVSRAIYRLFFHPLSKFPGPKLAAVTLWYEAYYDIVKGGQYTFKIAELHKEYGPIIRISPHELHINDPSYYEKLYRQDGRWDKYGWAYEAFGLPTSAICTVDHTLHKKRRAAMTHFFSKTNIFNQHEMIHGYIGKLRHRIEQYAATGESFDLGAALSALTTDIATMYIVGESYNNLDYKDFNQGMSLMIRGSGGIWRWAKHFRILGNAQKAMPLFEMLGDENVKAFGEFLRTSHARVAKLMTDFEGGAKKKNARSNLVQAILEDRHLPPIEKSFPRVAAELDTVTGAGVGTTAGTLRTIVYYVSHNPSMLDRLRSELKPVYQSLSVGEYPDLAELEQLPFLNGVLMEALRFTPGIVTRMARIAPDRDLVYGEGWVIPAGTPVGMTTFLVHMNDDIYKKPHNFDPDRWMNLAQRHEELKSFHPFSRGTRGCVGMHLAWAELYFTVPMLVLNFDFDLGRTTAEDVDAYCDLYVPGQKSHNGVVVTAKLH